MAVEAYYFENGLRNKTLKDLLVIGAKLGVERGFGGQLLFIKLGELLMIHFSTRIIKE